MTDDERKPDESTQPARMPFLVRFGGTVGAATLAALLGSSPAAIRIASTADLDLLRAWTMVAGLAIGPMLVAVPIARFARDGLRGFLAGDGSRALERVSAALVFAGTWLWFLSVFGATLRQKTHQHALAGVTFALGAAGSGVFLAFVARRLAAILASLRANRRALGTALALAAMAFAVVALGLRVAHAAPELAASSRAALVDGLALALALAFFARQTFDDSRLLARLGPPVAFVLLVVAMHTLATQMSAVIALQKACPVHFAFLRAFAKLAI